MAIHARGDLEGSSELGKSKLALVGPGLVVAAAGVGSGDLVAALIVGADFGLVLIWAVILGAIIKYFLNEGVGRWYLATGQTILQGWRSLGRWVSGYYVLYVVLFGLIYGAAVTSACALFMSAMFPILPIWGWAIIHALAGLVVGWFGRYRKFERIMQVLVVVMFITVVGSALLVFPSIGGLVNGLIPRMPEGSFIQTLGLISGVGGAASIPYYCYWIREKGWRGSLWISVMRLDSAIAYIFTAIFCFSLIIVANEFLHGRGLTISGTEGLVTMANIYGERFGTVATWLLLIGFWSASFTSLLSAWNGLPYIFADFVQILKNKNSNKNISEKDPAFRAYLLWLTFPSMLFLFVNDPILLVFIGLAFSATILPFLAFTLMLLLNSKKVTEKYKNGVINNLILGAIVILFITLSVIELYHSLV
ncbi:MULTISPECIES: Nramp family divalent metal transporter [Virgibacillus]|uniref:Mramp n=2 Tax=Virgibacillus TaxID=84406 RepID=A0A024QEG7_9BACI|nr:MULTISPECIES: Nramp family divalent metal transporter [Virgibacillus]EQB35252.1 iron transporter [Virgibacillus sp. CM-4]MYL42696.1 divalent metal cation transporter [Virgibacillus massiliensis]GGJ76110.1 iron transporter [Virgibacillus kapii]CDQ40585.1 Mramp [Virgibacillus massiliensis]